MSDLTFFNNSKSIFNCFYWFCILVKSYGLNLKVISHGSEYEVDKIDNRSGMIRNKASEISQSSSMENGIPFVIKRGKYISLPFSDYVSLLNTKEENDLIIYEIIKHNPKVEIEIRDRYEGNGFKSKLVGYRHSLILNISEDKIFKSFRKTRVQQPIQKAIKDGLTASICSNYESVMQFYNLHLLTRKRLGVPVQPKKFFYHLWNEIINKGLGYVVLISFNEIIISSGIFIGYNKIITYKYSASHPDYLKYRPNNLMLWNGILEAKKRGYEVFDFGRTDLGNEGLRQFKQGWGTIEEPLYYSFYPKIPDNTKLKFIKDKIVSPIIKHSPKFVCRLSGELFYKYFG